MLSLTNLPKYHNATNNKMPGSVSINDLFVSIEDQKQRIISFKQQDMSHSVFIHLFQEGLSAQLFFLIREKNYLKTPRRWLNVRFCPNSEVTPSCVTKYRCFTLAATHDGVVLGVCSRNGIFCTLSRWEANRSPTMLGL
jgi:hypothetical protein